MINFDQFLKEGSISSISFKLSSKDVRSQSNNHQLWILVFVTKGQAPSK